MSKRQVFDLPPQKLIVTEHQLGQAIFGRKIVSFKGRTTRFSTSCALSSKTPSCPSNAGAALPQDTPKTQHPSSPPSTSVALPSGSKSRDYTIYVRPTQLRRRRFRHSVGLTHLDLPRVSAASGGIWPSRRRFHNSTRSAIVSANLHYLRIATHHAHAR